MATHVQRHSRPRPPPPPVAPAPERDPADAPLFEDFRPVYETFNATDRLLLRHPAAGETITI